MIYHHLIILSTISFTISSSSHSQSHLISFTISFTINHLLPSHLILSTNSPSSTIYHHLIISSTILSHPSSHLILSTISFHSQYHSPSTISSHLNKGFEISCKLISPLLSLSIKSNHLRIFLLSSTM